MAAWNGTADLIEQELWPQGIDIDGHRPRRCRANPADDDLAYRVAAAAGSTLS